MLHESSKVTTHNTCAHVEREPGNEANTLLLGCILHLVVSEPFEFNSMPRTHFQLCSFV